MACGVTRCFDGSHPKAKFCSWECSLGRRSRSSQGFSAVTRATFAATSVSRKLLWWRGSSASRAWSRSIYRAISSGSLAPGNGRSARTRTKFAAGTRLSGACRSKTSSKPTSRRSTYCSTQRSAPAPSGWTTAAESSRSFCKNAGFVGSLRQSSSSRSSVPRPD